jgi:hypothetical protein
MSRPQKNFTCGDSDNRTITVDGSSATVAGGGSIYFELTPAMLSPTLAYMSLMWSYVRATS